MADHCAVGVCSSPVHCKEIGGCFSAPSASDLDDGQLRELCAALGWQGGTYWQVLEEVKRLKAAPKEAPSEASRWPNMNQTVAANAFWHPPHPVLKGWIHDCVYSTGQVLLPEGSTCTNCGATMIAPATPGTPGGGR